MTLRYGAAVTALLLLAGCDSLGSLAGNVTTRGQTTPQYRQSDYAAAGRNRDMWVVVAGSVAGSDSATLQQRVIAAMQRHAVINTRFTTAPQNHNRAYKTVILFNGPDTINGGELCKNPGQISAVANSPTLQLQAVFCRNDQFLTEVFGRAAGGNSLSNPNFDALINQTLTDLYTASRENQREEPGN